ncbi:MBL fold metallo-hydrolase [Paracoccus sp. MBLB3053]|uniref:MBL fold metallo-hydrolase n=1 Tax=Paracoccus aurantius TaxID=3073814 RepID=A0ABU2HTU1_9RHOB|nr:MBL fold metallo-hydrolase [Paracoccus sp. MBLB3053]MDS9468477.1 MBL fold metallo-hydrolase [Paracoccus sp. MBLB3053]
MLHMPEALRVITAPNPSPLTGPGTNSFLLGRDGIAVIDPGPDLPEHRAALVAAAGSGRITHIFVTHAHLDHSGGARALAQETGAPVYGFGPATAGRSDLMQRLSREGDLSGGEGLDRDFVPDHALRDGELVETDEWSLRAIHTPGHFAGHLSFQSGEQIFCGDVVMGWSSTLISPPDGDLADYFRTLARLGALAPRRLLPAHGEAIEDPAARIADLATHRRSRTAQILAALRAEPGSAAEIAARIYDVPAHLLPAATRNVLAHLIALAEIGAVSTGEPLESRAKFRLA